jgi:hypothetical protein
VERLFTTVRDLTERKQFEGAAELEHLRAN